MNFRKPQTIGEGKWYIAIDMEGGETHYLYLNGETGRLINSDDVLFRTRELAIKATEKYNKVIRIGGE